MAPTPRKPARHRGAGAGDSSQICLRALELASQAIGRLDDHQKECRDRYLEQRDQQAAALAAIDTLRQTMVAAAAKAAGAVILSLLGGMGTLVVLLLSH